MNFYSILERGAAKWPDSPALADPHQCLTYNDLRAAVESLAVTLQRAGIREGDRVGLLFPKGVPEIIVCFAVMRLGAVVVQMSPASKAPEIVHLSKKVDVDVFCYSPQYEALIPQGEKKQIVEFGLQSRLLLCLEWAESHDGAGDKRRHLLKLNAASIGFSSGTTSERKGIIISHDALLARARAETKITGVSSSDRVLYLLSIAYGGAPPVAATLLVGGTVVVADTADLADFPRLVAAYGVTLLYASPLVYRMMLNDDETLNGCLRRIDRCVATASALPKATAEKFFAQVGREIIQRYGLNECGAVMANRSAGKEKQGSVGRACEMDVMLRDESGARLKDPSFGELLVRGPGLFQGYYSPWCPQESVLERGWFRTGDLARRDKDGYYWIVGRLKSMINVGGVKVFPSELEEELVSHPDIDEAFVFGVPDSRFGEVPHAKIKLAAGANLSSVEILHHINRRVSFFKALRSVELVDQLPKTVTGKIRRRM